MAIFRKYNPEIHHRQSIRLQNWDYSNSGSYFITIRVEFQTVQFGRIETGKMNYNDYGFIVANTWMDIPHHYDNIELDEWVLMPDHFHGIVIIKSHDGAYDYIGAIHDVGAIHVGAIHESPLSQQQRQHDSQNNKNDLMDYCNRRRKMLLSKIIGRFKMVSAKQINMMREPSCKLWQRNYYEHIIRDNESFNRIRKYIRNNPGNWKNGSSELNY